LPLCGLAWYNQFTTILKYYHFTFSQLGMPYKMVANVAAKIPVLQNQGNLLPYCQKKLSVI
jgi:hypothetical protein